MCEVPQAGPAVLTPRVYDLWENCRAAHVAAGLDFEQEFNRIFTFGYVFKGPDYLMMGLDDPNRPDAWLCWWADSMPGIRTQHESVRMFLSFMPHYRPFVSWDRRLKNKRGLRYYSTDRLMSLTAPVKRP